MTVTVSPDRRADTIVAQRWGPPRKVTIKRSPGAPLGVSIVGGKVDIISSQDSEEGEEKAIFGIFIKNVVADSPAGLSGELQTGDRILEVDGVCVRSAQHERAVQLIKAAGDKVTLTVQSLLAWNTDSSDVDGSSPPASPATSIKKSPAKLSFNVDKTPQHEIKITVTAEPDNEEESEEDKHAEKESTSEAETARKPVYSDSESSDEEDERELQGRTYSDKGVEIDRASAGAIKRSKEEKQADPEEEDDFGYTTNGVVLLDEEYVRGRKVFGQVVCTFRYGREEDEVMGLNFYKELFLASEQIYPPPEKRSYELTRTQERLMKKLGETAHPFHLTVPAGAPGSVTLQPGLEDEGEPCGVHYYIKLFVGDSEIDRSHRRSTIALGIRKVQYAPSKPGPQPCTVVRKDFVLSPGQLELELTLDKQLYMHGETVAVNMSVRNHSNKVVKKIKANVVQSVDVVLFQNGQYRNVVASIETQDGCPLQPGSSLQKVLHLSPTLASNRDKRGVALDGQLKRADTTLASTTLLLEPEQRDAFGIVVSYSVKVKLYLGALSGELVAELPFILMHPKEGRAKVIHADSQADVEMFRQDTVHHQESIEVY